MLGGVAAAAVIFPGIWLYGAYQYNYNNPYRFRNTTANENQTVPVTCLCEQYRACGCDDNDDTAFLSSVVGDGNYAKFNRSLINVANVNGTRTIVLNGTLPNGTDPNAKSSSSASRSVVLENAGFWVVGAIVGGMLWML